MPSFWIEPLDRTCPRKGQEKHRRRLRPAEMLLQGKLRRAGLVLSCQSPRGDFEFRLRILFLFVCDPFQQLAFASMLPVLQGARLSSPRRSV